MIDPHATRSLPPLIALGLLATFACAVAGCTARVGDPSAPPLMNEYGPGTHISSVLGGFYGPASWVQPNNFNSLACPYPAAFNVYTTGVTVTAVDTWDETGNGAIGTVYVQDTVPNIPVYAGMSLFSPSFTPPDLRVLPGDVLDVTGSYEEFIGPSSGFFPQCQTLPQISGSAVFRFDGTVPTPVVVTPEDLSTFDGARKYLSMLVTVRDPNGPITIAANGVEKSGRYAAAVTVPSGSGWAISDELFDVYRQEPLSQGQQFESVTGIVTYFYSYQLAPRSLTDFVLVGGGHPAAPDAGTDGG